MDKPVRAQRASTVFETGQVLLPAEAPWLAEYRRELLAFPGGRHDDQVNSTMQFLAWAEERHVALPDLTLILITTEPWPDVYRSGW